MCQGPHKVEVAIVIMTRKSWLYWTQNHSQRCIYLQDTACFSQTNVSTVMPPIYSRKLSARRCLAIISSNVATLMLRSDGHHETDMLNRQDTEAICSAAQNSKKRQTRQEERHQRIAVKLCGYGKQKITK